LNLRGRVFITVIEYKKHESERRQYYRLNNIINCSLSLEDKVPHVALINDISEGGLKLLTSEKFKKYSFVCLNVPQITSGELICEVLVEIKMEYAFQNNIKLQLLSQLGFQKYKELFNKINHVYSMRFIGLQENQRSNILGYVFAKQNQ
jgi:c-di-GMP-binding flagellar brake protein YcgR